MNRRGFLAVALTLACPPASRAQDGGRARRVAILMTLAADDPESRTRLAAFVTRLHELGWTQGQNVRIDVHWGASDRSGSQIAAAALLSLQPDVILANGSAAVAALRLHSGTTPVVFTSVIDPVGSGFVESLGRPGAGVTGFTLNEPQTSGKWVELLKEIAPRVERVAVLRDPGIESGNRQFAAISRVAANLGIEGIAFDLRDSDAVRKAVTRASLGRNGGIIVTASALANSYRDLIVEAARIEKLPAIYFQRFFVTAGGLMSFGPDLVEQYRHASQYVDRILRGEKPADLPVQAPTRYQLSINTKAAAELGLILPITLLGRADELIEP